MRAAIVEDQAVIRHLLTELMDADGFDVEAFPDADTAQRAMTPCPDLLVVDWLLPDGTVEAFLRGALAGCPQSRGLIISGYPVDVGVFPSDWARRIALLEKPFTASMLRESIAALFAQAPPAI